MGDEREKIALGFIEDGKSVPSLRKLMGAQPDIVFQVQPKPTQLQMRSYARFHFLELKRLGDLIHTARPQRLGFLRRIVESAQEDNGNILQFGIRLQRLTDLIAIHEGHLDIGQDQIRRHSSRSFKRQRTAGGGTRLVAALAQHTREQSQIRR